MMAAAALTSCVRFELDGESSDEIKEAQHTLRISEPDAVVLCPLAATVESQGAVSLVWAEYPYGDDRLQLMHARVTSRGELLLPPHGLAELGDEVADLRIESTEAGLSVLLVERDASELLRVSLGERFEVAGYDRDELTALERQELQEVVRDQAMSGAEGEHCLETIFTSDTRLQIRRTQVDGELPLFVESFSL